MKPWWLQLQLVYQSQQYKLNQFDQLCSFCSFFSSFFFLGFLSFEFLNISLIAFPEALPSQSILFSKHFNRKRAEIQANYVLQFVNILYWHANHQTVNSEAYYEHWQNVLFYVSHLRVTLHSHVTHKLYPQLLWLTSTKPYRCLHSFICNSLFSCSAFF